MLKGQEETAGPEGKKERKMCLNDLEKRIGSKENEEKINVLVSPPGCVIAMCHQ